ncbi:MAG: DNA internalization-related competence protein ComEC/Rec2 [Anaerolineae bacterium]|nr:DNA internalization-related competence protein ComEC/Rec2 [Phycisphaerae bacterium]
MIPRRPALLATALFIVGIFCHRVLPAWPVVWIIAIAVLLGAGIWRRQCACSSIVIAIALILCGALAAQLEAFYYPRDQIGLFATDTRRLAQLELKIDNEPRVLADSFSDRPMPPKQIVTASVKRVLTHAGWVDASGDLLVQISQPHPRLAIGQTVRVLGMLERPAPAMNPGQFDWAEYYREQRILASIHIAEAANIQILSQSRLSPGDWIRVQARRSLAAGFPASRSLDHALLRALLLGDHDPELRDVQEQFKKTGTSHHLAISGMHVAVLAGFVLGIGRLLRARPRVAVGVMLVFTILYGIAALPSPPVVRSILLCLFFGIGLITWRSLDAVQLLALSVLAMLIRHPLDLYNAGFQLSCGTVLGLLIFTRPFANWLATLREDPLALRPLPQFGPQKPATIFTVLRRCGKWAESLLAASFAAGLIAWLVSMPLIAFHFEQLNVWAIPASLILAPIVLLALIGGLAKVALTLLFPSLATSWASMAAAPMELMRGTLAWLAKLPWSDWPMPAWPIWGLFVVYAIYLLAMAPCPIPKLRILLRSSPIAAVFIALIIPFRSVERAVVAPNELRLTLLYIGAGQAAVVQTPSGRTIMIDAGSTSLSDPLRKCIAPFLRHEGCTQIDTMLLTHTDHDHVSSASAIATAYDVRQVLIGGRFRAHAIETPAAGALLQTMDALDAPPRIVKPGERIALARDVDLEILWPPPTGPPTGLSSNDSGIVAKLWYAGRSILITGDVEEIAQRELLTNPQSLKADVLIAPHHGSSESTTDEFVEAVNPAIILSSNDRSLSGKQKRFDRIVENRQLYRTHAYGAITLILAANGTFRVEPFVRAKP